MYWIVTPEPHAPEITQARLHQLISDALIDSTDVEEKILHALKRMPQFPQFRCQILRLRSLQMPLPMQLLLRCEAMIGRVFFRIGSAITQSKIDIRSAIVTTLGAEAIDTLYVTELTGGALTPERANEVASHLKRALK